MKKTDQVESPLGSSFRDPNGFVFQRRGRLLRQINPSGLADYRRLMDSGLYAELRDRGWLVAHEELAADQGLDDRARTVLQPEPIPFVSYPYEWCFGQLRAAAILTLRCQRLAMQYGMSLRDASAFNVQFRGCRPSLIDTLSFGELQENRPWVAYRQFCQHFLAPLALMAYRDASLGSLLRLHLDGIPLDLAAGLLAGRGRFSPRLALHIRLHAKAQRRYARRPEAIRQQGRGRVSTRALLGLLDSLEASVRGLKPRSGPGDWRAYYRQFSYSDTAIEAKERIGAAFLDSLGDGVVWDLGANVGRFSRLATSRGQYCVALESDRDCVEANFRMAVEQDDTRMLPVVMDLSNPSPACGWAHDERMSLAERAPARGILALALVHHLAVANNVPLASIATFISRLAQEALIEFVPKTDPELQRMLASRQDIFAEYSRESFERVFGVTHEIRERHPVAGSGRIIYSLRRRA